MAITEITGTNQADTLDGAPAFNLIHGLEGDDDINGWVRDDTLYGGAGNDTIFGFFGNDFLSGGDGNDVLTTSERDMGNQCTLRGGAGDDSLFAVERQSQSYGGAGDDWVTVYYDLGGAADGGSGTDVLVMHYIGSVLGSSGGNAPVSVRLTGPDAHASAYLQSMDITGFEMLHITTSDGDDTIIGGGLDDRINVFAGDNVVRARDGQDVVTIQTGGTNRLEGGAGRDLLIVVDSGIWPDAFRFVARGDAATDDHGSVIGGFERYQLWTGDGADRIVTGDGSDVIRSQGGDDDLAGGAGADRLLAGDGNDSLRGGKGDDLLSGGTGRDHLTGGQGADEFLLGQLDRLGKVITDFETGLDRLLIGGRNLGGDFPRGTLDATRLVQQEATAAEAQFIWRAGIAPLSHDLIFDANGTGTGGEVLVATFLNGAVLSAADILIL